MSHAHIQGLLGRQGHMTGKQGWLLHDGIVMATMGMGIPEKNGNNLIYKLLYHFSFL